MQEPANPEINVPDSNPNDSEFAQKEPLVTKQTITKYAIYAVVGILLFAILITVGVIASRLLSKPTPIAPVPTPTPTPTEEVKVDVSTIAYIKNDRSIWLVDTTGENKRLLIELPASSIQTFSNLTWKSKTLLTYSLCEEENCTVQTYDIVTKASNMDISQDNIGFIDQIEWAPENNYLAFLAYVPKDNGVNNNIKLNLNLKAGTITKALGTVFADLQNVDETTRVTFSPDEQLVAYSFIEQVPSTTGKSITYTLTPRINIYQVNGVLIDQISGAADPIFLDNNKIAYKKDEQLMNKTIGQTGETGMTIVKGFNVTNSPDTYRYAYWTPVGGFSDAQLIIFDTNLNVSRNILRGVLFPEWISNSAVVGIRADNCLGSNCQLYEYQTISLSIVNIDSREAIPLDQARNIRDIDLNFYAN